MWQNKIQNIWEALKNANPSRVVCKNLDPLTGQIVEKTYSDLLCDLEKIDFYIGKTSKLKIVLLMEKSYFSLVSVFFCLFKGHCFIPVFSGSKTYLEIISAINPDLVFCTSGKNFPFKTVNLQSVFESELPSSGHTFSPAHLLPDATAYIISTSGTTGQPKLIPVKYRNLNSYIENIFNVVEGKGSFHLIQNFEISFDPYLFDLIATVINAGCLFPIQHADVRNLQKILQAITGDIWISLTPSLGSMALSILEKKEIANVRCSYFLGEKLKTSLCKDWKLVFPNTEIYNMYGPAEITVSVFCHKFDARKDKDTFVPIGSIHSGHEYKLGPKNELMVKGPQVFDGYLGSQPSEEWFNTGDIVEVINTELFVMSRSDLQLKINGRRFQPEELEMTLFRAGISGYVVPVTLEEAHKEKTHLVFATNDRNIQIIDIIRLLQPKYDIDFIPKRVLFLEKYPMSQNGKVDRNLIAIEANRSDLTGN